jgi:two-component system, cell cycle sensor histidine kinase and response regulator CckA
MRPPLDPTRTVECAAEPVRAAALTIVAGGAVGRRYRLGDVTTIGRVSACTIVVDDTEASRSHARISMSGGGGLLLEDLESRNGTFVNGVRIERRLLAFGDKISIGSKGGLRLDPYDPQTEEMADRQRFETVGRLGLGMAHDLGNIISSLVAGMACLRALDPNHRLGDEDAQECMADLDAGARRASELVRSMLSVARGRPSERGPVNVSQLVSDLVRMLRHTLGSTIGIEAKLLAGQQVLGSRSELHQVLLNLCLNARDAMPEGGTLRIGVELVDKVPSALDWTTGRPAVLVTVADTGIGMDAATSRRVFEPFFTTKREGAGYGLGLSTVRELVILHGGRIGLETAPHRGATFRIYLPVLEGDVGNLSNTGEKKAVSSASEGPPRLRMLLVDDEAILRRSMGRLLKMAGWEVIEVGSGSEALVAYRAGSCDLVLLDSHMPEMDGLETQARLLELDPKARIAFASGHVDPELEQMGRERGAVGFLQKPYSVADVMDLMGRAGEAGSPFDAEVPTRVDVVRGVLP